jgi:hypothetical protein
MSHTDNFADNIETLNGVNGSKSLGMSREEKSYHQPQDPIGRRTDGASFWVVGEM